MDIQRAFFAALERCYIEDGRPKQEDLAERSGVHQTTISKLLKGKIAGSFRIQESIAQAFGYDLVDFLALGKSILNDNFSTPSVPTRQPDAVNASPGHVQIKLPRGSPGPLRADEKQLLEQALEVLRAPAPAAGYSTALAQNITMFHQGVNDAVDKSKSSGVGRHRRELSTGVDGNEGTGAKKRLVNSD